VLGAVMKAGSRRRSHGLTLVELMLAMALGLFIVAIAMTFMVNRLREHRALLLESRLVHDLRSTAALVARDLRRAGHWGDASAALWQPGSPRVDNPYTELAPASGSTDVLGFAISRDAIENHVLDSNEQFGFRLHQGAVEMMLGGGSWQALTDTATMQVLSFSMTPQVREVSLAHACAKPCALGAADCPPTQVLRSISIALTARSITDAQLVRSAWSDVRLRNDVVRGRCPE
jgi:prepilin peptidase dependent protein B